MMISKQTGLLLFLLLFFWGLQPGKISAKEPDSLSASTETSKVRNHRVGFQLNPHPDGVIDWINGYYSTVWALRYGYQIQPKIMIGPEISGVDFRTNFSDNRVSTFNSGVFVRYEVYRFRKFGFAVEISPYLEYYKFSHTSLSVTNPGYQEGDDYRFKYFVAPVIHYGNPNAFFSFDFMWKFSHLDISKGYKSIPSIRFNFNF